MKNYLLCAVMGFSLFAISTSIAHQTQEATKFLKKIISWHESHCKGRLRVPVTYPDSDSDSDCDCLCDELCCARMQHGVAFYAGQAKNSIRMFLNDSEKKKELEQALSSLTKQNQDKIIDMCDLFCNVTNEWWFGCDAWTCLLCCGLSELLNCLRCCFPKASCLRYQEHGVEYFLLLKKLVQDGQKAQELIEV